MSITFNNVKVPILHEFEPAEESVWKKGAFLITSQKNLVYATSGKGKTTFLNLIYGIRKDYTGNILIFERDIKSFSDDDWSKIRREKISMVFQDLRLFDNLSVGENLILKNDLTQMFSESKIKEMLAEFDLQDKWNQTCGTLSQGQKQRIAILRSLLQPFDFILLDEPFSHLDGQNAEKSWKIIERETKRNNAGIIISSLSNQTWFTPDQKLII